MKKLYLVLSILVLSAMILSACAPKAAEETPAYPAESQPTQKAAAPTSYPVETVTKITVATDATWPPFEYIDEATKEIVGYDIDLFTAIGEKAGLEIEFVNTPFDPLLAGIATCQFDAAISAITITEDRKKEMLFSDPYINAGQIVVVEFDNTAVNSKDDLVGKTVGAQLGTTGEMEAKAIADTTVKPYDTVDLAFLDLQNGQIDAVIADYPTAFGFIAKSPDKIKAVGDVFTDESYGIAVCNTKPELVEKINAGLKAVVDEGILVELEAKWLSGQ
ncbi:MAG: basic amino acid ABC transporter substrate-binding protein [Bellilinea sp.]